MDHRPAGYSARQQNSRLKLLNRSNPKPVPDDRPIIAYRQWCERFWPPDYLPDPHVAAAPDLDDTSEPEYAAS